MPPPWGPPRTQENSWRLSSVGTTSVDCSRCRAPDSRDSGAALVAASPAGELVVQDPVADPADQGGLAAGTAGVFVPADPAGQVAGVDELEAGGLPNPGGPKQGLGCGVVGVLHLVVLVEGRHVPGDAGR